MQADKTSTARILKSFTRKEYADADLEKILASGGSLEDLLYHIATQPDFSRRFPQASRVLNGQKVSSAGIFLKAPEPDGLRFAKAQIVRGLRAELYEVQKQWAVSALRSSALEKEILALKNTLAALEAKVSRQGGESLIPLPDEDSAKEKAGPANSHSRMVNLHRLDTSNTGDLACAPADYFPQDFGSKLEITGCDQRLYPDISSLAKWFQEILGKILVVGGGGLLDQDFFAWSIQKIASLDNKKAIWGAGHNGFSVVNWSHERRGYNSDLNGFNLIGVRDWGTPYEWVPCASCMSPLFDKTYEKKHAIAAYLRSERCPKELEDALNLSENVPILYNDTSFERVVEFLGSAELIVTNSYHGIYWATLLGRKVVGIPISSKFFSLKHPVPLCHYQDWIRFSRLAAIYPEALSECREANLRFREKVLNL